MCAAASVWTTSPRRFVFSPAQWRRGARRLAGELAAAPQRETRQVARSLLAAYDPLRQIFARLCPGLCPACARVCCAHVDVKGLFDQADLIQMAALGLDRPPLPRPVAKGCAFLGQAGCRMPWQARPYACLHYLCAPLLQAMSLSERQSAASALREAALLRADLLNAFLEGRGLGPDQ